MSLGMKLGILAKLDAAAVAAGGGGSNPNYYVEMIVQDTVASAGNDYGNQNSQGDGSSHYDMYSYNGGAYANTADYLGVRKLSGSFDGTIYQEYPGSPGAGNWYAYAWHFLSMGGTQRVKPYVQNMHGTSNTVWSPYASTWMTSPATSTTWTRAELVDPDFQMGISFSTFYGGQTVKHESYYMEIRAADTDPSNTFSDGTNSNVNRDRLGEIPTDAVIQSVTLVTTGKKSTGGYKGRWRPMQIAQLYGLVLFTSTSG